MVAEGCGYPTFADWFQGTDPTDRLWAPSMWMTYFFAQAATGIWNPEPMRDAMARISPTPVLLIAAGRDKLFNRQYFEAALEPKEAWFREEDGHIDALFARPGEYEARVIGFLDRYLAPDPAEARTIQQGAVKAGPSNGRTVFLEDALRSLDRHTKRRQGELGMTIQRRRLVPFPHPSNCT